MFPPRDTFSDRFEIVTVDELTHAMKPEKVVLRTVSDPLILEFYIERAVRLLFPIKAPEYVKLFWRKENATVIFA